MQAERKMSPPLCSLEELHNRMNNSSIPNRIFPRLKKCMYIVIAQLSSYYIDIITGLNVYINSIKRKMLQYNVSQTVGTYKYTFIYINIYVQDIAWNNLLLRRLFLREIMPRQAKKFRR